MQLLKKCRVRDVKSKEMWKSKIGRVKFICFIRKPKNKTHEQKKKKKQWQKEQIEYIKGWN